MEFTSQNKRPISEGTPLDYFAIAGFPRGGTTYLTAVLHRPPLVVTMSEAGGAWKRLYQTNSNQSDILRVFHETHRRIARGEAVPTLEGTRGFEGAGRVDTWNQEKTVRQLKVGARFVLGMKNPEVFLAWLNVFQSARIPCIVSVRHPLAVINSWARRGHEDRPRIRNTDRTFANGWAVTFQAPGFDEIERRINLYNHLAQQIIAARASDKTLIIRFEDWFGDGPSQLSRVCTFLGIDDPGDLRPQPILPDPIALDAQEIERIGVGCRIAEEFGYDVSDESLGLPRIKFSQVAV